MYNIIAVNKKGNFRNHNNDYILVNNQIVHDNKIETQAKEVVAVICDGVGDYDGSNDAAKIAVEIIREYGIRNIDSDIKKIEKYIINNKTKKGYKKSFTTIVGIASNIEGLLIFNAGDSKAYIATNDCIEQLSIDDSKYSIDKALGLEPSPETKNIITNFLGQNNSYIHKTQINELRNGDMMLLCSDGVSNNINYKEIMNTLGRENISIDAKVNEIVELIETRRCKDNLSIILIEYIG